MVVRLWRLFGLQLTVLAKGIECPVLRVAYIIGVFEGGKAIWAESNAGVPQSIT